MDSRYLRFAFDPRSTSGRALFAYSLWLRVGFVGISALVAGIVSLFDGTAAPVNALAAALAGGALGVWSWRRALTALDRMDAAADGAETAAPDAAIGRRATLAAK